MQRIKAPEHEQRKSARADVDLAAVLEARDREEGIGELSVDGGAALDPGRISASDAEGGQEGAARGRGRGVLLLEQEEVWGQLGSASRSL